MTEALEKRLVKRVAVYLSPAIATSIGDAARHITVSSTNTMFLSSCIRTWKRASCCDREKVVNKWSVISAGALLKERMVNACVGKKARENTDEQRSSKSESLSGFDKEHRKLHAISIITIAIIHTWIRCNGSPTAKATRRAFTVRDKPRVFTVCYK